MTTQKACSSGAGQYVMDVPPCLRAKIDAYLKSQPPRLQAEVPDEKIYLSRGQKAECNIQFFTLYNEVHACPPKKSRRMEQEWGDKAHTTGLTGMLAREQMRDACSGCMQHALIHNSRLLRLVHWEGPALLL